MKFLNDVAAMQVDEAYEALNGGSYGMLNDAITSFIHYASNIRERRELSQNYYFAMNLAHLLSKGNLVERALSFNLFVKSHGYFNREIDLGGL